MLHILECPTGIKIQNSSTKNEVILHSHDKTVIEHDSYGINV